METNFRFSKESPEAKMLINADTPPINIPTASGGQVDASCNRTITITCLQQLYNAVGFTPSGKNGNKIGITGYLEQFANIQDLQTFYAEQRPDALNSTFEFISVKGQYLPLSVSDVLLTCKNRRSQQPDPF